MTFVSRLELKNFRCHKEKNIDLNPNVTIITGRNGSGKTSILEAIYISLRGKSFKGSLRDIVNTKSHWWTVNACIDNDEIKSSLKIDDSIVSKQFTVNNNKHKILPLKHKKPVVLFEPDDMRLINGSPSRRRDYLDELISQYDAQYSSNLNKYEKALKQRNYLLKKAGTKKDDLFVWNLSLSEYGEYICKNRIELIKKINNQITKIYQSISGNEDKVKIEYSETDLENTKQKLFNNLEKSFSKDILTGSTSIGPHRHDILIYINDKEAKNTASRGEIRTIVLSLKFFEIEIIEKNTGQKPIILLDDVYSELDEDRQRKLNDFTKNHQVVITSTQAIDNINNIQI